MTVIKFSQFIIETTLKTGMVFKTTDKERRPRQQASLREEGIGQSNHCRYPGGR